ncbi:MAG: 4-alpha-glucanotransferase [Alphaproteobacteria bacterium]|nr:4-alpha-glucanotransferase [Alphaproteobacteria bacterium]
MSELLHQLADKLGIATSFRDGGLIPKEYKVEDKIIRFFADKLGYKAGSDDEIKKSLEDFDKRRWQKTLASINVVECDDIWFDAVVSTTFSPSDFRFEITSRQTGEKVNVDYQIFDTQERRTIGKTTYIKWCFKIYTRMEIGYYDIEVNIGGHKYKMVLAVAPETCYENEIIKNSKIWGYALQLYSVRSNRNWGVGDFTDLAEFIRMCGRCGADIIGLNPLNVLTHDFPENASPYCSISRLFLNPIYIDIENVPEFRWDDMKGQEYKLDEFRASELIKYEEIYPLKVKMLEKAYERFTQEKNYDRQQDYKNFCEAQGEELEKLATFQALYETKCKTIWGGWRAWEEEYKNPSSKAVKDYQKAHHDRIEFFKFMQFEADRQFNNACALIKQCGLKVGLYRDLAVGVGQDSAELWADSGLFIKESGAGAPPDAFFSTGQRWCLGAFNPYVLKDAAYEPYIKILRANMHNAGALRIDHVMGLMRLYVIPDTEDFGTYIRYNFRDMMNILAIESCLNKCHIVGESIGNVPAGFLEALEEKHIYSLSVLWAERQGSGWGGFSKPETYPEKAFTSVGTHDMSPLRMWWFGYDIALMKELDLSSYDDMIAAYHKREADRKFLLEALDNAKVWPEDKLRQGDYLYGEAYPEGIEEAVNRYVASSASKVFLAQLEDILHVEKLQNLPGTDIDKHPNWRRKLPVSLEKMEGDIAYIRNIAAIKKER